MATATRHLDHVLKIFKMIWWQSSRIGGIIEGSK
jgi:hypothetical protein